MFCHGCYDDKPRAQFEKGGSLSACSRYCHACRPGRMQKATPAVVAPIERPHRVAFIVGYGWQLFPPHVRLTDLAIVDRETAFRVGEIYNANAR